MDTPTSVGRPGERARAGEPHARPSWRRGGTPTRTSAARWRRSRTCRRAGRWASSTSRTRPARSWTSSTRCAPRRSSATGLTRRSPVHPVRARRHGITQDEERRPADEVHGHTGRMPPSSTAGAANGRLGSGPCRTPGGLRGRRLEQWSWRQWSRCSRRILSGPPRAVVGLGVRIPEPQPAGARPRAIRATYRIATARSGTKVELLGVTGPHLRASEVPGALRDRAGRQPGRDRVRSCRLPIPVGAG
jgi:hypothetical protein